MSQNPRASLQRIATTIDRGSGKNAQLLDWCAWDGREEGGEENNFCIVSLPLSASQNRQGNTTSLSVSG